VTGKMLLAHPVLPPNPRPAISDTYQLTFSACSAGTVQLGFDISHSKNIGGNCDVSIEGNSEMLWLGEAKIYNGYGKLMGGFQQLCDRYATGMPNQTNGAMLFYFFNGKVASVMKSWRKYLEKSRAKLTAVDVDGNALQFRTAEPHAATEAMLNTVHMPVPLMHEPTDVLPPPKR
ncbi:hypothetical protein, partial [Sphingobium sp.]|uniref:hypothetical protein n=1 Tax=Sphingobium sp. TaxID=1912891 RepID=UPI0025D5A670